MRSCRYHCMMSLSVMLMTAGACVAQGQTPPGGNYPPQTHQAQRLPSVDWESWQPADFDAGNTRLSNRQFDEAALPFNPHEAAPEGPAVDVMPPPDFANYAAGYVPFDDSLGPSIRIFEPKARVYFDTGWEAPDKLDIFHDGSLAPSINFLELYWAREWADGIGHPDWRWGPNIGLGISSPADGSRDGTVEASGAPVLMVSYGLLFEFPLSTRQIDALREDPAYGPVTANRLRRLAPKAGVEFGYALGVSSDETLDFSADGAIYVGITVSVAP